MKGNRMPGRCLILPSPVGVLTLTCDAGGKLLTGLFLSARMAEGRGEEDMEAELMPVLRDAREWLRRYWQGEKVCPSELPLAPAGSPFQQRVWQILCEIPYGKVTTYGEIARRIAREEHREKMSAQAVGGAVGRNPVSLVIPCHRVVGAHGTLTGYGGGLENKIFLLRHEGIAMGQGSEELPEVMMPGQEWDPLGACHVREQ